MRILRWREDIQENKQGEIQEADAEMERVVRVLDMQARKGEKSIEHTYNATKQGSAEMGTVFQFQGEPARCRVRVYICWSLSVRVSIICAS